MKFLVLFTLFMLFMGTLFGSIDINTASADEMSSLKGIGTTKASAIVEYRKTHCFQNIDEITQVKGIGPKFLEKNRAHLSVSECSVK